MKITFDTQQITKDLLLKYHSQETYLEYYLGIPVQKGLSCNPLRDDHSATCSFYRNKAGEIIYKDFSGFCSVNFIGVVMLKYDVSYYKAMQIIANDFGIIKRPDLVKTEKPISDTTREFKDPGPCKIQVEIQTFSDDDLKWWKSFGIDEKTLKKFKVYSCKNVFLNGEYFTSSTPNQKIFGYYRGKDANGLELWRIYFPGRSQYKFLSNWKGFMIQGAKQLPKDGDLLVITKSLKDVMLLDTFGVTALAPCSENICITKQQLEKLKLRFKHIVMFYDNDLPGISNMRKFRKDLGLQAFWIPRKYEAKDISDYCKKYGRESTKKLIEKAIELIK